MMSPEAYSTEAGYVEVFTNMVKIINSYSSVLFELLWHGPSHVEATFHIQAQLYSLLVYYVQVHLCDANRKVYFSGLLK